MIIISQPSDSQGQPNLQYLNHFELNAKLSELEANQLQQQAPVPYAYTAYPEIISSPIIYAAPAQPTPSTFVHYTAAAQGPFLHYDHHSPITASHHFVHAGVNVQPVLPHVSNPSVSSAMVHFQLKLKHSNYYCIYFLIQQGLGYQPQPIPTLQYQQPPLPHHHHAAQSSFFTRHKPQQNEHHKHQQQQNLHRNQKNISKRKNIRLERCNQ